MGVHRRSQIVGSPMLVTLPDTETREHLQYHDSGEGGLAFFVLIPELDFSKSRQICIAGGGYWPEQDVSFPDIGPMNVDGMLLIGSTGESLFSDVLDQYFQPTEHNLTEEGKKLFSLLRRLYGENSLKLVTLLDT